MRKILNLLLVLVLTITSFAGILSIPAGAASDTEYFERGGSMFNYFYDRIDYHHKTIVTGFLDPNIELPEYQSSYSCGITAGGVIVSWYNKDLSGLIPGHTAGTYSKLGTWKWTGQNATINSLFGTMYTLMNAANTGGGVTIANYLGGLNSYASGQNYTFTSSSIHNGSAFTSDYRTAINSGKLLSVFMDGFNMCLGVSQYSGYDIALITEYNGTHIMVVYGYADITYYDSNDNIIRVDNYLVTHDCMTPMLTMVRLNNAHLTIDDCYITHIS